MSSKFIHVANTNDIKDGSMKLVEANGEQICIINIKGKYYAINNVCTHHGGPLNEGTLDGYEVECPWHGARFDVRNGEVKAPPARIPIKVYEVKIEGDKILIKL